MYKVKTLKQAYGRQVVKEAPEEELWPETLKEFEDGLRRIADAQNVGIRRKLLAVKELLRKFIGIE